MTLSGLSAMSGLSAIYAPPSQPAAAPAGWALCGRTSGLELYLPFEEGTGTTTADQSGNTRNGTLSGAAAFSSQVPTPAPCGGVYSLDLGPSTGDVTVADTAGLRFSSSSQLSLSLWFRLTSWDSGTSILLTKGNEYTSINYMLRVEQVLGVNGKAIDFLWTHADNSYNIARLAVTLALDVWYHVAVSHTFGSDSCLIYLDGVPSTPNVVMGSITNQPQTPTTSLRLGWAQYPSLPVHRVIGQLDDVRVYRGILTAGEVSQLAGL